MFIKTFCRVLLKVRQQRGEDLPVKLCPKCSANPITATPIWKREFANGEHPIRELYRIFFEIFFTNFRSRIKDSKWGRKCIFMNCASRNGSPQQIPLRQLPFANEAKPHSHCRAFWAMCDSLEGELLSRIVT